MIERKFPDIEQVHLREIQQQSEANCAFLEAKYLGNVADFRAKVISLLVTNHAIHDRWGWIAFRETQEQDSNVLIGDRGKETLISFERPDTSATSAPHTSK